MKKLNRLSTIIALILIATFILPSTAVIAAANDSNLVYFYGDLNANGEIDEFDYLLVKRGFMATLELDPDTFLRGDVNGNGELDIYDYLLVKRHVMGTYTIPMVPLCEHEIESIKAKDATCDENGNIAYFYCVKCEKCYSDAEATNEITPESTVIAAKGHDYTELKNDETAHWKECDCGEKSEMTSHTFGAWATVVDSTCTAQGTRMRVCITCGYIASEKLPLLEHTYGDWLNDTENHWKECVCGNKFGASTHTYGEWETVTEPTCTETGVKKRNCTICGYSQTDSISVVSHTYGEWETVTEPTCTEQGTKKRDCVDCGHTETDAIAMLPHSYDKTNYNSSTHWKECVCGKKSEAVAHTYTDVVTPPTESEQGFTTHTCNECGRSYKDSYVKPTASVGLAYEVNDDGITCTITGIGDCSDTDLVIPSEINGYKVTTIGFKAFYRCTSLTSINIPDSVTSIGDSAFYRCTSLTSITIPDSVTSIGDYAFYWCDNLTTVTIGNSVTSIGDSAFEDCDNLTTVTIGNSVTSIGDSAFLQCKKLTSINIPDSVTSIGGWAFNGCSNLKDVFYQGNVENWLSIQFESNTSNPCYYAKNLYFNDALVTELVIPDSVTSIGDYAFCNCDNLTTVTIGNSVTSIGDSAFEGCTSLTSINIPDSVTSIGDSAFYRCTSLTSINIPDSVTSIGDSAFYRCSSLKYNVYDNAYYLGNANNPYVVLVQAISEDITSCTINPNTKVIHSDAFYRCTSLTSIIIPDSVTSIGYDAFYECSSLKYNVYDNAYYLGNANNPYVVLVQAISEDITSCTINPNTKVIHSDAFYRCTSLTSIIIPDSVTSIGDYAFYECDNLTTVTIANGVTSIGYDAFGECYNLTSITIPDSVTSIGGWAFNGCSNLTTVTIGNGVTSIGGWAFYGCSNLKDVYYAGSQEEWEQIKIGFDNSVLTSATIHYNSK